MKDLLKNSTTLISILAGVAAVASLILQIQDEDPMLEVKTIYKEQLTDHKTEEGLRTKYWFNDSLINNLWKLSVHIENVSSTSIVGEGMNKSIIRDNLIVEIPKEYRIIDTKITLSTLPLQDTTPSANKTSISFLQWKPSEGFDLTIYAEQLSGDGELKVTIDERQIINGKVIYSDLNDTVIKRPIAAYLPNTLRVILYVLGLMGFSLFAILLPIGLVSEAVEYLKYKSWEKTWKTKYDNWINELIQQKRLKEYVLPGNLSEDAYKEANIPKPKVPTNNFGSVLLIILLAFVLSVIPILWMIDI